MLPPIIIINFNSRTTRYSVRGEKLNCLALLLLRYYYPFMTQSCVMYFPVVLVVDFLLPGGGRSSLSNRKSFSIVFTTYIVSNSLLHMAVKPTHQ